MAAREKRENDGGEFEKWPWMRTRAKAGNSRHWATTQRCVAYNQKEADNSTVASAGWGGGNGTSGFHSQTPSSKIPAPKAG